MTKEYSDDLVTQRIPEDPPSVKKAKDELAVLIADEASADDIAAKRAEIQRLYRYEDDKAAGLHRRRPSKTKKGLR